MEKFVSVWEDGETLPESYVFPPEQRPGDLFVPPTNSSIPVIDIGEAGGNDHAHLIQLIMEASQQFGAFQVINHGVSRTLMDEARKVFKEFFELPMEELSRFCSNDNKKECFLYTSTIHYDEETLHLWRDALGLKCAPLEQCVPNWPDIPPKFRDVVREYVVQVNEVGSRLIELICQGLGLEPKYFENELSLEPTVFVNHYPPCPDPRLTLGVGKHSDRSVLTILMQGDVPGLHISKDGEWIGVDTIPDAFVIILGNMSQILSNGKLKNGDHRAVTSAEAARQSVALFVLPTLDCYIEPAKPLVNAENPALYRGFRFHEYLSVHAEGRRNKNSDILLSTFRIN